MKVRQAKLIFAFTNCVVCLGWVLFGSSLNLKSPEAGKNKEKLCAVRYIEDQHGWSRPVLLIASSHHLGSEVGGQKIAPFIFSVTLIYK